MKVPILLLVVSALAPLAVIAAPPSEECKKCDDVGMIPCSKHKALSKHKSIDPWRHAVYCNAAVDCEHCLGLEWLDCEHCENPEAAEYLALRKEALIEGGKKAAKYDKFMERRLTLAESKHFLLVAEVEPRKVGKGRANAHQFLHIYLDRLEAIFADYCETLGAKEDEFAHQVTVFLWEEKEDHDKASEEYCKWESDFSEPFKHRRGSKPQVTIHVGDKKLKKDEDLHRMVVHQVVHCLMNLQKPTKYTGDSPNGWADVGVAHWFTVKHCGESDLTCFPPVRDTAQFVPKRWRTGVRKMIDSERNRPLEEYVQLIPEQLTGEQHAVAYSIVDFLIARDPGKFNLLLKRVRSRTPFRDSVKEIYGWKIEEFEEEWESWVLENYKK